MAAGTLLYVVFFEVLEKERKRRVNGLIQVQVLFLNFIQVFLAIFHFIQVLSFSLGFAVMISVQLLEGHEEEEEGTGPDQSQICQLSSNDLIRSLPVNFTCVAGKIKFL